MENILSSPRTTIYSKILQMFLFLCISSGIVFSQAIPYVNHQISKEEAIKYIQNFKNSTAASAITIKGGGFNRDIIDKMLAQSGCIGIRVYYGMHDDGKYTFILVGIDSSGDDLSDGIIAQMPGLCPPFCSSSNKSLSK